MSDRPRMNLIFRDTNSQVVGAFLRYFDGVDKVTAECCDIFHGDVRADAIISPANCIGRMDGGIDAAYVRHFGWELQSLLCWHLNEFHGGYTQNGKGRIEVGQADIVSTGDPNIRSMIMAPTMDWPPGDVSGTQNAYLAFRASLRLCRDIWPQGGTLLTPGLGTLTGRITPDDCAAQMRQAWDEVVGTD